MNMDVAAVARDLYIEALASGMTAGQFVTAIVGDDFEAWENVNRAYTDAWTERSRRRQYDERNARIAAVIADEEPLIEAVASQLWGNAWHWSERGTAIEARSRPVFAARAILRPIRSPLRDAPRLPGLCVTGDILGDGMYAPSIHLTDLAQNIPRAYRAWLDNVSTAPRTKALKALTYWRDLLEESEASVTQPALPSPEAPVAASRKAGV